MEYTEKCISVVGLESLGSKYATAVEKDTHTNIVLVKTKCVSPEKFCSRIERVN